MNNETTQKVIRKNTDWSEDKERYILYADLMGFKERVRNTKHDKLKEDLKAFKKKLLSGLSPLQIGNHLKVVQYSDSILIVDNDTNQDGFNRISKAAALLMHTALEQKFPLKGALAKGLLTFDHDSQLYFGQPLIDAYLLHDELQFYGIIAHHTIEQDIKNSTYQHTVSGKVRQNPYIYSPIHLKKSRTAHYHLAYNLINTARQCPYDITTKCHEWLDKIEETVSGNPRIYVDNTRKILNDDKKLYEETIMASTLTEDERTTLASASEANTEGQKAKVIFPIRATL